MGAAGLCAVRHLDNWGVQAEPLLSEVESQMSFVTQRHLQILAEAGIAEPADRDTSEHTAEDHVRQADLVVDALVGYGLEGAPTGLAAAVTEIAAVAARPVLALDIPTGVNGDTGSISSPAVEATTTLVFDLPKTGQLDPACANHVGELYLADLGIPRAAYERCGISIRGLFAEGNIVRLRR
ncbi:MAG TPA: NAD(P)H-hydrate epimerase [Dehalococcoidia bacterium]|nr:NAD(P)H-hydrate epimerase [Dehalococcoidia bacterium]